MPKKRGWNEPVDLRLATIEANLQSRLERDQKKEDVKAGKRDIKRPKFNTRTFVRR